APGTGAATAGAEASSGFGRTIGDPSDPCFRPAAGVSSGLCCCSSTGGPSDPCFRPAAGVSSGLCCGSASGKAGNKRFLPWPGSKRTAARGAYRLWRLRKPGRGYELPAARPGKHGKHGPERPPATATGASTTASGCAEAGNATGAEAGSADCSPSGAGSSPPGAAGRPWRRGI
ncbi:MAG TPA: hypothetical protein VMJ66_03530, partial [Geobacteraceae bacterium]|nr:hypothetical protein [Geobacteraceae bacterium]